MANFLHRKFKQREQSMQGENTGGSTGYVQALVMIGFLFVGFFSGQMLFQDGVTIKTEQAMAYFTPGDDCTQRIVDVIDETKCQIYVQAYGFTSDPICKALVRAAERGVIVRLLLDKSNAGALEYSTARTAQEKRTYSLLANLKDKAEIRIDHVPGIAHNKVIIADEVLITGSFNFTTSAQTRNAENILIIRNKTLAEIYEQNWQKRYANTNTKAIGARKYNHEDDIVTDSDLDVSNVETEAAKVIDESESDISDAERDVKEAVDAFSARKPTEKKQKFRKSAKDVTEKNSGRTERLAEQKVGMSRTGRAWRTN